MVILYLRAPPEEDALFGAACRLDAGFQSDCNGEQNNIKTIILGLLGMKLWEFVWLRVC